jgi:hypothetical protein
MKQMMISRRIPSQTFPYIVVAGNLLLKASVVDGIFQRIDHNITGVVANRDTTSTCSINETIYQLNTTILKKEVLK